MSPDQPQPPQEAVAAPPQQPNPNSASPPGANAASGLPAILLGPPILMQPTKLNNEQLSKYIEMARNRTRYLLSQWEVRELTLEEISNCRITTNRLIRRIRILEERKASIAPLVDPQVEISLFLARVDYRTTFGRVFRLKDLPTEIICEIFSYVVWDPHDTTLDYKGRRYLTQVCRMWRRIVFAEGTMWNLIWFKYTKKNAKRNFDETISWFRNAGTVPKDLRISDDAENPIPTAQMAEVLELIKGSWTSVRLLVVVVNDWEPALMALRAMEEVALLPPEEKKIMIVKRFELHRTGPPYVDVNSDNQTPRTPPLFGGVHIPSLTTISLDGMAVDWSGTQLSNLTILDLRRMPQAKCPSATLFRQLIQSSPNLYKLILDGAGPREDHSGSITPNPIPLNKLKIFALSDFSPEYGIFILSLFSAPNLRDLTLMRMVAADYTSFFHRITGLFKELRILTLYQSELQPYSLTVPNAHVLNAQYTDAVVQWFLSIPELTYLRIGALGTRFFRLFLMPSPRSQELEALCPKITILEWQGEDVPYMMTWLARRKTMGVPIQKLYARQDNLSKIEKSAQELLGLLAENGGIYRLLPHAKAQEEAALQSS